MEKVNKWKLFAENLLVNSFVDNKKILSKAAIDNTKLFQNNDIVLGLQSIIPGIRQNNENFIAIDSRKDIIIVIDPGHGTGSDHAGSQETFKYKHKKAVLVDGVPSKDAEGNYIFETDAEGNVIEESTTPENLAQYLLDDLKACKNDFSTLCIVDSNENIHFIIKRLFGTQTEASLTYKVSLELVYLLKAMGYTVINTRSSETVGLSNHARNEIANRSNAHYFISLHADGSCIFISSGSHSIYHTKESGISLVRQKEFAEDIIRNYSVVAQIDKSVQTQGLLVLSPTENHSFRKTLVELGFTTNPDDLSSMMNNKEKIAKELAKGLDNNIVKNYRLRKKVSKYKEQNCQQERCILYENEFDYEKKKGIINTTGRIRDYGLIPVDIVEYEKLPLLSEFYDK